jgi:MFS family permease
MVSRRRAGPSAEPPFPGRPLLLFLGARVAAITAYSMGTVAVGWQIYGLTGSALFLGLVGLAQFLPQFLLTLVVGLVADRFDRRTVSRACMILESAGALVLALGSRGGWIGPHGILAVVFLIGVARAFEGPSFHALMPRLVEPSMFPRAAALSAATVEGSFIAGPALGGFLYAAGPAVVYFLVAGMGLLGAALLSGVRDVVPADTAREPVRLSSVFDGLHFIRRRPVILGAISLDMFAVLLGGATALMPIYAKTILNVGPGGLGLLRAAPSLGAVTVSLVLSRRPLRRHVGRTMFAAVVGFGLGTIGFALSRSMALSLAMLVFLGGADVVSVVIRQSLVQMGTPDAMRGRVSAVNSLFIGTSNQLGQFESGLTAAWLGTVPAALLGGVGTIAVALLWMFLFPPLRNSDTLETAGAEVP